MIPDSIELIIVTPEKQLLRESVVEVVLPGAEGELGILPGHAPLSVWKRQRCSRRDPRVRGSFG